MTGVHLFERLDSNVIPRGAQQECRVVMVTLNEMARLPWLLQYYRSLGVARFFIIDNNSTDGSVEFLRQQKDCHIFSTRDSYRESRFGGIWQQNIIDRYGENHWWLVVDADEMFVYPASENISLPQFARYLEGVGAQGVSAFMLDMYSREPVAEALYLAGKSFTDVCPYFDTEYTFWPRPRHLKLYRGTGRSIWQLSRDNAPLLFPAMEPVGGPRLRRFYPYFRKPGPRELIMMKAVRHLRDKARRFGIKIKSHVPPVLFKVPFLKADSGVRILDPHSVSPISLAPVTGALLHFKFFADFHDRVMDAMKRGEHFDGGSEYARYLEGLKTDPKLSFYYEKSAKYEDSRQLVALGLIKDDPSFAAYRQARAAR